MKRVGFIMFLSTVSVCVLILLNGCETTPASEKPVITPSTAVVKFGSSVEFNVSGGFEYTWSLQDETLGRLDTLNGSRVVYRSMYEPGVSNSALQILTVSSTLSGVGRTTNSASIEKTAEAHITHIPAN
jgi:hypothetical protein